jgi:hypothetical protein
MRRESKFNTRMYGLLYTPAVCPFAVLLVYVVFVLILLSLPLKKFNFSLSRKSFGFSQIDSLNFILSGYVCTRNCESIKGLIPNKGMKVCNEFNKIKIPIIFTILGKMKVMKMKFLISRERKRKRFVDRLARS